MTNDQPIFDRYKTELDYFFLRYPKLDELVIKQTPKPDLSKPDQVDNLIPFFTIKKENERYYAQFVGEEKQEINSESLAKNLELLRFFYPTIKKNNDKFRDRNNFSSSVFTSLAMGLGIAVILATLFAIGSVSLPFILFNPLVLPITITIGSALVTAASTAIAMHFYHQFISYLREPAPLKDDAVSPEQFYHKPIWRLVFVPFELINSFGKFLGRLVVNNVVFKYTIGLIIAIIANQNPHYKVKPENLSGILQAIIFPGASREPQVDYENNLPVITVDVILSEQYREFKKFKEEQEKDFKKLRIKVDKSTTITAYVANNFSPDLPEPPKNSEKYLTIYFCGNSSGAPQMAETALDDLNFCSRNYEGLTDEQIKALDPSNTLTAEEKELLKAPKPAIPMEAVVWSPPRVLNSTGAKVINMQDFNNSSMQLFNYFIEQGYDKDKISFYGFSLGCATSIQAARMIDIRVPRRSFKQFIKNLFSRSPDKFSKLGLDKAPKNGKIRMLVGDRGFSNPIHTGLVYVSKVPYIGKLLTVLFYIPMAFGLWATGLHAFSGFKFALLDNDRKWYTNVICPKKYRKYYDSEAKVLANAKNDAVFGEGFATLHNAPATRFARFFSQLGKDKKTQKAINISHKIVVVSPNDNIFSPERCGHADEPSNSKNLRNRAQQDSTYHSGEATTVAVNKEQYPHLNGFYCGGDANNHRQKLLMFGSDQLKIDRVYAKLEKGNGM